MSGKFLRVRDGAQLRDRFEAALAAGEDVPAVACYPWGGSYRPETRFLAGWNERALYVALRAYESDPRATVTEPNGRVWCDSCMEFFLCPADDPAAGYLNFEMNALGTLLCHYGPDPAHRAEVRRLAGDLDGTGADTLVAAARGRDRGRDYWQLLLTAPAALIARQTPFAPRPGMAVRANFYKCGDETAVPHFGCHFPIDPEKVPEPDFHRPDFFGRMVLE